MISKIQKTGLHYYTELGEKVDGINPKMSVSNFRFLDRLWGDCSGLSGDCALLIGDCTGVFGSCYSFSGDFDQCEITAEERVFGVYIGDLFLESEEAKAVPKELYHKNEFGDKVLGKTKKMRGDCSKLWGDCSGLNGNCTGFVGDCTGLDGDLDLPVFV